MDASSAVAWAVLTDYNEMPAFVSSMKSSRKVESGPAGATVEQVMVGRVGIFRKRIFVRLDIFEKELELITFQDVSGRSFKYYVGSWELSENGTGTTVAYRLEATPAFFAPDFVADGAFKKSVAQLLAEVRREILRRTDGGKEIPLPR